MREILSKGIAIIYMIAVLVMFWLPIYMYSSDAYFPSVILRHPIASGLIWYGATILLTGVPAMYLNKTKYAGRAFSIGLPIIIIGLILTLKCI